MRIRSLLAAIAAAATLLPGGAFAASRVGVIPFAPLAGDVPQGAGEKGADLLQKELKNQSDFDVVARPESSANAAATALTDARAKLAEARKLVAEHKGTAAAQSYRDALAGFGKGAAELETFDDVIACEAELGTLLYRLGKDSDGQRMLLDALRLGAGQALKAMQASATFVPLAEGLQKKATQLSKGTARVDSSPEGADLYVDGQSAGKTPVLLRDLPAGNHYLRALLPSGDKWGAVVDVAGHADLHLRAQSGAAGPGAEVSGQLAENKLQTSAPQSLKQAAQAQNVSLLVFGALHRTLDGLALDPFLYSVETGKVSRLKRVAFDTELLEAGLQMDKVVSEIQQRLSGDAEALALPAKVAPDLAAERELATEYHFGGIPDAPIDQGPGEAPPENSGRRVIRKEPPVDAE